MRFLFIGGDMRMVYAAERIDRLYDTGTIGLGDEKKPRGKYSVIVLPMPLTKDNEHVFAPLSGEEISISSVTDFADKNAVIYSGGFNAQLWEICRANSFVCENYCSRESLVLKNAALTAEAAAGMLIQNSPASLLGAKALIIGFGRIGKALARRLAVFGTEVTVAARNPADRTLAEILGCHSVPIGDIILNLPDYDCIVNTAPAQIFTERHFAGMKDGGIFMELATLQPEPSRKLCDKFGLKYISGGGLPGKYSPKTAGEYIAQEILTDCGKNIAIPGKDSD